MDERRSRLTGTFQRFADEARNRASVLRGQVVAGFPQGPASLKTVLLHAHTLAGSGETMGAADLSAIGAEIEALLNALPAGSMPDAAQSERLDRLSRDLAEAAGRFDVEAALETFLRRLDESRQD